MSDNITEHINNLNLNTRALPSNNKYGYAIFKREGVLIIRRSQTEIEFWVGGLTGDSNQGGGSKRRVRFWVDEDKLLWRCTGNPKDHEIFCKHCVAAALYLKEK